MRIIRTVYTSVRTLALVGMAVVMATSAAVGVTSQAEAAAGDAKVASEKRVDAQTLELSISSPSIEGWRKTVRVLVPQGWSKTSPQKYPTLWLLHGGMDDSNSWLKNTEIKQLAASRNMMVVIPDTSWCSAYSDWYNGGKWGQPAWETYITEELRTLMETNYRADGSNAAVAGPSMGGLGAMKFAAHHPDMFKAAASFSGNVDPLHAYNNMVDGPDLPGLSCFADWKRVWGDYKTTVGRALWERNDPYVQADKLASQKYLYVASGDGVAANDAVEKQVYKQSQALVQKLQSLNIPVDSHFYSGNHTWPYWNQELKRALPGVTSALNVQ